MKIKLLSALVLAACLCAGCQHGVAPLFSQAAPETYVEFDPITKRMILHNSKDTTLKIKKALAKKTSDGGYEMELNDVDLIDNASNPRLANVQQLAQVKSITRELSYPLAVLAGRVSTNPTAEPFNVPPPWATEPKQPTTEEVQGEQSGGQDQGSGGQDQGQGGQATTEDETDPSLNGNG